MECKNPGCNTEALEGRKCCSKFCAHSMVGKLVHKKHPGLAHKLGKIMHKKHPNLARDTALKYGSEKAKRLHEVHPNMAKENGRKIMLKLHEDPDFTVRSASKGGLAVHKKYPEMAKENGKKALRAIRKKSRELFEKTGFRSLHEIIFFEYFETKFNSLEYEPNIGLGNSKPDFLINNTLVVELHGGLHNVKSRQEQDNKKKSLILNKGYKYLVIWNEELQDLEQVADNIKGILRV